MAGCVYRIRCIKNGKLYIGSTIYTVEDRWKSHVAASRSNACLKHPLYRDIHDFGPEQFEISVIRTVEDTHQLRKSECFFIKKYDTIHPKGYNLKEGGINKTPENLLKNHKRWRDKKKLERWGETKNCEVCNKSLAGKRADAKYCNINCQMVAYNKRKKENGKKSISRSHERGRGVSQKEEEGACS